MHKIPFNSIWDNFSLNYHWVNITGTTPKWHQIVQSVMGYPDFCKQMFSVERRKARYKIHLKFLCLRKCFNFSNLSIIIFSIGDTFYWYPKTVLWYPSYSIATNRTWNLSHRNTYYMHSLMHILMTGHISTRTTIA